MSDKDLHNNENTSQDVLKTLESYISTYSDKFSEIGRKIVYAIFASAWGSIFVASRNGNKSLLYAAIILSIIYLAIEMIYYLYLERTSRKLHILLDNGKLAKEETEKEWNSISDGVSYILFVKLFLITVLTTILIIYYWLITI